MWQPPGDRFATDKMLCWQDNTNLQNKVKLLQQSLYDSHQQTDEHKQLSSSLQADLDAAQDQLKSVKQKYDQASLELQVCAH